MKNSSTVQALQAPLLGVKPDNELDQEHHIRSADIAVLAASPPPHLVKYEDADEVEEQDSSCYRVFCTEEDSYCYDVFIIWVVLPFLLFVQFGVAFLAHDENTSNMSWSIVNVSIVLFALTVWLYRESCIDGKIESCLMVLLPEIILNTVLILILVNETPFAFYTLLLGMEILSVLAIIATVRFLYCTRHQEIDEERDDDEENKEVSKADYIMIV